MAERVGFEPTVPEGTRALQARLFVHSSTSPALADDSVPAARGTDLTGAAFPQPEGASTRRPQDRTAERVGFEPTMG